MKPRFLLLSLSLAANLALATLLLRPPAASPTSGDATPSPRSAASPTAAPSSTSSPAGPASPSSTASGSSPAVSADIWSQLYSENPDQFTARLKAAGFSYREIRAIILPLASKRMEAARAEIMGERETLPYWRANASYSMPEDPAQRARLAELMQKESKVYQKFFSSPEALAEDEDMQRYATRRFGNLPLEKLQQVAKIQTDYDELQSDTYMKAQARPRSELTADERNQLKLLETELQRDLQQALSPEQYSEYLLRSSPTAQILRQRLDLFRPTEAEYKALFALQRPIDEQFSSRFEGDDASTKARFEAMKKLEPQIEAALGPERYADYQQASMNPGDKVARLVVRLDLPLRTIGQINTVREDVTARAKAVRSDNQLTPAERDLQLSALANEAKTKLSATLGGERGYEAYTDIKGDWLRGLTSSP